MQRKKASPPLASQSRKTLEALYEHRQAIDALIHSLEQYDRLRAKAIPLPKADERLPRSPR